ncbi:MAG: BrnT family toxin, partial [Chromatiaceae bacterium]
CGCMPRRPLRIDSSGYRCPRGLGAVSGGVEKQSFGEGVTKRSLVTRKSGAWLRGNRRKHGIDFADAVEVFYDELACTMADPDHHAEQRFVLTGTDAFRRVLVVVYAQPDSQTIRIVSARAAIAAERRHYEQG